MTASPPPDNNTRGLLKSMAVIGSAQFLSIIIRILKAKLVAVMLGPSGTGLLSVFANLQMLGSQAAGLGLPQSGVRDLATARGDPEVLGRLRRVLMAALALQGGIAMIVIWALREQLSVWLLGETGQATEIGLVGVAVLLFLLASSQRTLLQGMRRMGDLGRLMVLGTLAGALAGILAVWLLGQDGLIWFLLAEPLGAFVVGLIYVRRLPFDATRPWPSMGEISRRWRPMVHLGMAFMLGGLLTTATLLLVRTIITRDLGLDAAGQFAASWTITTVYVGFLLQAMGADYFPRLSQIINDHAAAVQLMNDQMQLVLALGGPILLLMIGLAPWMISLLYSAEFEDAIPLLQWQMLGNVMKLTEWVIGFSFVAAGRSGVFLYMQIQFNAIFLSLTWMGLPLWGLEAAGIAFMIAYLMQFIVAILLARRLANFRLYGAPLIHLLMHVILAATVMLLSMFLPVIGAITAIIFFMVTTLIGGREILSKLETRDGIAAPIIKFYQVIGWPVRQ